MTQKVDFGFREVEENEKETLVQGVFSSVATNYDLMNDFMSFGLHRLWKDEVIKEIRPYSHEQLLDVAGGTGDIAYKFLQAGGEHATVLDLNQEMLAAGKLKYPNAGMSWVHGNAEDLPIDDDSFDYYTISFGIRNVTHIDKVIREAHRVLKPGGKFVCLEFSNVTNDLISKFYDFYSFKVIPFVGEKIANDKAAYDYLVESIRKFPTAPTFKNMIEKEGFEIVEYRKMCFGVVAIHTGYKI